MSTKRLHQSLIICHLLQRGPSKYTVVVCTTCCVWGGGVNPAVVNWLSSTEFQWQRSSQSWCDDDEVSSVDCALPELGKWHHESTPTCKGISDLQTKYPQPKCSLSVVHKWSILKNHLTLNYTRFFLFFFMQLTQAADKLTEWYVKHFSLNLLPSWDQTDRGF